MAANLGNLGMKFRQSIRGGTGAGLGVLVVGASLVYGLSESIYTVDGGHRAIIFSRWGGILPHVKREGLHFRIPWLQWPIIYDVRARPRRIASPTGSKDLQTVNITLRLLTKPDPSKLPIIYRQLGTDYDERVLPSIANEVLKSVVAQFNAAQLITQRERVSKLIFAQLRERASDFNIIMDDVSITDLSFGREYTAAVEAKQVAQQEAARAQYTVQKAEQEQKQKIVQAEGEAKSAELIGEAVKNNPGFLQLRRIDAAREIASTVANSSNRVYLNAASLLLNVNSEEQIESGLMPRIDEGSKKNTNTTATL